MSTIPATVGEMMDYLSHFNRDDKLYVLPQMGRARMRTDKAKAESDEAALS